MAHRGRRKKPFKLKLKKEIIYSVVSVVFIILAVLVLLSFTQQGVFLGQLYLVVERAFGWVMFIVPFLLLSIGLMMTTLKWSIASPNLLLGGLLLFAGLLGLTQAGELGLILFESLAILITGFGAGFLYFAIVVIGSMILTNTPLDELLLLFTNLFTKIFQHHGAVNKDKKELSLNLPGKSSLFDKNAITKINIPNHEQKDEKPTSEAKSLRSPKGEGGDFESQIIATKEGQTMIWKYPPLSILSREKGGKADRGDVKENAHIIESTLDSFGIGARVEEVNGGPAVTQYAIRIKEGTKLSKVKALATDMALALAAPTGQVRIEAPIPGRNLVGIEIPNISPEFVTLNEVLTSPEMKKEKSKLAIGLGLGVSGKAVMTDIKKMPHVLVAGATGSGKSICINNIICTLLFRNSPQELKLILVDPKRVELTGYNGIPHLLTPVITEAERVIAALQWATKEMDKRYKMFAEVGARNIEEYNELSGFTAMNYIIIVIDELADIMLTAPGKVEDLIVRLAQMARATGIHLIVATQRPSVNVITGLIKANIPTRIAFNVTSMIDSRVIIDSPGAEKLLGRGDMLYVPPDRPLPTRIQGTFVNNKEIRELINFLKESAPAAVNYQEEVTEKYLNDDKGGVGEAGGRDERFDDAVRVVTAEGKASTSYLQRRMGIGYNKAAKIMDQLQEAGVIGEAVGAKARPVLISSLDELKRLESTTDN